MQQDPLLKPKLYIPPLRPELVSRPRLIERLNAGLNRKLTLISAPAGFGKTTLVSDWLHRIRAGRGAATILPQMAWLSLDENDNDLARFLTYFVAALQTLALSSSRVHEGPVEGTEPRQESAGNIGTSVLSALQSPEPPPAEALLTSLINEIAAIPDRIVLVLDDYHLIEPPSIHEALAFLLQHLPPQMHLVIATREDPPLPLARLRARGQLTELRIADLRFTPAEAALFFNQVMGLNLSAERNYHAGEPYRRLDCRAPTGRPCPARDTCLAGNTLHAGERGVSGFIRAFAGDNRYIVDYLVEEVLQRQPEGVRSFLLQTSILDRLSGPLCDAVRFGRTESPSTAGADAVRFGRTESPSTAEADAVRFGSGESPADQKEGRALLEALERGNLFVIPLDDKRQWYRYHHLFADVLQAHLMEEQPNLVPTLHRRASEWYEDNGSPADAIRHALAAEDCERAAGLVELAWREMDRSFQSATWLGWVKALPDELVRARPVLSAEYAWALLDGGELEAAEARLRDAERWLDTMADMSERPEVPSVETCLEVPPEPVEGQSRRMVVVDEEEFRSLPVTIANARAYHAQALGDVPATVKYARQALDLLPEG